MSVRPDFGSRRLYHRRTRPAAVMGRPLRRQEAADLIEHLLWLQELATASGQTFEEFVDGDADDVAFAARAAAEIRRVQRWAKPSHRKRGLLDLAAGLEWKGVFQSAVAESLASYAIESTAPAGRRWGAATNRARQFVITAICQLVSEELAKDFREQRGFAWLFSAGGPGRPSAGHTKVAERARALATAAGEPLSELELSRQVSEVRRSALSHGQGLLGWTLAVRRERGRAKHTQIGVGAIKPSV